MATSRYVLALGNVVIIFKVLSKKFNFYKSLESLKTLHSITNNSLKSLPDAGFFFVHT